jgi:2-polyprenyl-6-hydroxyphenyl methylase/3-demethylubiquinone-9 3-methyltransferase
VVKSYFRIKETVESGRSYYREKLSAERLQRVYEIASPRVRQYLQGEIDFVLDRMKPEDSVLELGCGYGRVLDRLAEKSRHVFGIDNSPANVEMCLNRHQGRPPYGLALMDARELGFGSGSFDMVACIQNGISAFKVEPLDLIKEALRVTRKGGLVLFSSYAELFWPERLKWFRRQAEEGLLGRINEEKTGKGVIVCEDGFKATTFSRNDFADLVRGLGLLTTITEWDQSSLFCEIKK